MQKIPCYLFPLVLLYSAAFADTIPYSVHRYTDENGLPQNSVKFIVPDANGFLWLGTEDGLVKFSGHNFTTFNRQKIPISSNRISHIVPGTAPGYLYAITHTEDVIVMKDGKVAGVRNNTVPRHEREAGLPAPLSQLYAYIALSGLHRAILEDTFLLPANKQLMYRITRNSVHVVEQGREKRVVPMPQADPWRFFLLNEKLYYLCREGALLSFRDSAFAPVAIGGDIETDRMYRSNPQLLHIYYGVTGHILLRIGGSLYSLTLNDQNQPKTQLLIDQFDFDGHAIACAYYDNQHKRLFLGSYTQGLFVINRKPFITVNAGTGAEEEVQYAQAVLRSGGVLASFGNVLQLNGPTVSRPLLRRRSDNFSQFMDRHGNIWMKNVDILSVLDSKGERLLNEWRLPAPISGIYEGRDGSIWIGTISGLFRMNPAETKPMPTPVFPNVHNIRYMQEGTDGILWASTLGGLYRLVPSTGKAETIKEFDGMDIRSLYFSRQNELWVTTYGDGFFLYAGDKLVQFPLDKYKYLATSHCILEDSRGFFWIPTNKGLFKVLRNDLLCYARGGCKQVYYYYYDRHAGFKTNEFNGGCQPCGVKVNEYLSFPTMNGLVWVNAGETDIEAPDKNIYIESAVLEEEAVAVADTFMLPAKFSLLKLIVTTPYFGNPHNILIDYSLTENEYATPEWHEVNDNREVTLSSLPSGTYQLTIRMRKGFGANNYTYKKITLVVDTIFYNTWQFTVLAVLLLVFGVWAYTKLRLRYIKHKNDMLQQRIEKDTRELQETLKQLTLSELNLRKQNRMQELLIASLTHDIKNPLRYLVVMLRHLKEQPAKGAEPDHSLSQSIHVLYEASYRMFYLTDNLLQFIRLHGRSDQHAITYESFALHEVVEQKIAIFRDIALTQSTVVINEVPPELTVRSHPLILGIIIHNLLDNAIKYTSEGSILVSAKTENNQLGITIRDTGIGIEPATVAWYNAYYNEEVQSNRELPLPGHAGLGLVIVREMIRLLRGKVVIESENSYGTQVSIMLPTE